MLEVSCPDGSVIQRACGWGCVEMSDAHCARLLPAGGGVTSDDLSPLAGLLAIDLQGAVIDGDDGSISGVRLAATEGTASVQ